MSGGQLKDYTNLSSDRFQASNLTQVGNSVGYSTYGKSAGSIITVTSDGKFKLTPSDAVSQDLGVAATDFDTLDEVFVMLDRYNGEPANTFARYNAATQQGLSDENATVYANDTSLNNPAMVTTTQSDSPYTTLNKDTRGYLDITTNAERSAIGDYF